MTRIKWFFLILFALLIGLFLSNKLPVKNSPESFPHPSSLLAPAPKTVPREGASSPFLEEEEFQKISPDHLPPIFPENGDGSMMAYRGHLSFLVSSVQDSVQEISRLAQTQGGYTASSQISQEGENGAWQGIVVIKVPSEKLDLVLTSLRQFAQKIISEQIQAQDESAFHRDLSAQLKNAQASETQLIRLMERSASVSDILSVQRELSRVRGEIERLEAQLSSVEKQVQYATLSLSLATQEESLPLSSQKWRPLATAKNALRSLISLLKLAANLLIWFFVFLSPFFLLLALPFLFLVLRKKRKRSLSKGSI